MKPLKDTEYNETTDGLIYPFDIVKANVKSLEVKSFDSGSIVFNILFRISPETKGMDIKTAKVDLEEQVATLAIDEEDNPITLPGKLFVGKEYKSVGVWLTPSPEPGQGWKNRKYVDTMESLGVKFQEMSNGKKKLGIVEEQDILGKPALIKLGQEFYTNKSGETGVIARVIDILSYPNGKTLDADDMEDLPF